MNKLWFVILALTFALFFTACNTAGEQENYIENDESYEEIYAINDENEEEIAELYLTQQEMFLADLDYMLYALENNFALFDVAYWARGIDIQVLIEDMKNIVIANPDMDAVDFMYAMIENFSPLHGFAHFIIETPPLHDFALNNPNDPVRLMFTPRALARWSYPHVLNFYQSQLLRGQWSGQALLRIEGEARRQMRLDRFLLFGKYDEVEEINRALALGDINEAAALISQLGIHIDRNIPNVSTEILEEGQIAYLSINRFFFDNDPESPAWYSDKETIHSFFEEIRDYSHLIIDLRRNTGGIPRFFEDVIVRPIINEPVQAEGFVFAAQGYYSNEHLEAVAHGVSFTPETIGAFIGPSDNRLRTIPEMLAEFDLSELNLADLERMGYGFPIHMEKLYPIRLERFGYQSAFGGKVWLLTSDIVGSAAQISSWLSKESGFATHVGETTGGNFGGPRTAVALPNTGMLFRIDVFYVTDSHGRPLEAGTVPHHFNREGMDALETALALITEGDRESVLE